MDSAHRALVMLLFTLLAVGPAWSAPRYITPQPLVQELADVQVGPVAQAASVQVPIITWGGDIATIHANGDSANTRPGSVMAELGLDLNLVREDVFSQQLRAYMQGRSPYLRGTMGMINVASEILAKDQRTEPVVIYQMTWSAGGDALVVKPGIHNTSDLRGRTIALQAYGPHVDYMTKILDDAGLKSSDVKLRWLPDLTGTENSPAEAFLSDDIDAAFVIIPDALLLTSGGTVGTGAEGSVKGAKMLLSTKTANRIIADVYAVRSDYYAENPARVEKFVQGLLRGEEKLRALFRQRGGNGYDNMLRQSARLLLDTEQATTDVEGLYADAEFAGEQGNTDFFANPKYPRSFAKLTGEIQPALQGLGLIGSRPALRHANLNYASLGQGLARGEGQRQRFDAQQVATVVATRQQQNRLGEGTLFSFEIFFQPNQNTFSADLYQDAFDKVIEYASTYGGALITVEGHSDPLAYLKKKKSGGSEVVLGRIKQSAKNLSLTRAVSVRDSLIGYAENSGITLDRSQFAVVGHGIAKPRGGVCGEDPCAPKTEKEWRDNMRVEFRIIQVEAESGVFSPL